MKKMMSNTVILWLLFAILVLLTMLPPNARAGEKKITDTEFLAVSAYLVAMTVFDVESTYAVIRNGGHENNPLMKPLFKSGRLAVYGVQLGIDALCLWVAHEMRTSKHKELRQTWWLVPMVVGTGHGVFGGLNLRYAW